jgi:hypothetical protein
MVTVNNRLEEHTAYISALYFILIQFLAREFEQRDDPLGAAAATADLARQTLSDRSADKDLTAAILVEFFDEVTEVIRSRMHREH